MSKENKTQVLDQILDHDYDGIKEYDNPLPGWWVWLFILTVIWAFAYAAYAFIGPGVDASIAYEAEMKIAAEAAEARAAELAKSAPPQRDLSTLLKDPELMALGASVFSKNCAACHQADGGGMVGPNLTDEYFLHGAKIEDTRRVIHDGVVEKGMLAWGKTLKPNELDAVTIHVMNLRGTTPAQPKAPQGVTAEGKGAEGAIAAAPAQAEGAAEGAETSAASAEQGKALYVTCTACHGAQGEGNAALNAPALASQQAWYVERQLKNFKAGVRGTHEGDTYGAQMRPMSMTLPNDDAFASVAAYIERLPQPAAEDPKGWSGDAKKGATAYMTCVACHGAKGEGNAALNAPKLSSLPSWYLARQLKNFRLGLRGAHEGDTYGAQMRPMAMSLVNDQAIQDVVAYIISLNK